VNKRLTVIVFTHERKEILQRAICYYSKFKCNVLISDSSNSPFISELPSNIQYFHHPGDAVSKKLDKTLSMVEAEYVCLSADDDFLSEDGLATGVEYLDSHSDYVSVIGNVVQFKYFSNGTAYRPDIDFRCATTNLSSESDDLLERVGGSYREQHEYALHRTKVAQKCMHVAKHSKVISIFHFSFSLVSMCYGKHKILPIFWMARDLNVYTKYKIKTNLKKHSSIDTSRDSVSMLSRYFETGEGGVYKSRYINEISNITDKEQVLGIFDYISEWDHTNSKKYNTRWIRLIIRCVLIRTHLYFLYENYRDGVNRSSKITKKYMDTPGYPWSNNVSKYEFKYIMKIINNFKLTNEKR
jgi:glycosyltransferase domain-containing protein